jgi:hypothetical protein
MTTPMDPKQPKTDQTAMAGAVLEAKGKRASKSLTKQTTQVQFGGAWLHFELEMDLAKDAKRSKQHGVPCQNPTQTRLSRL